MKTHFYKEEISNICTDGHLTIEEIYERVKELHPSASRSSIYRNIEDLLKKGTLRKLEGIGNKAYIEKNIGNHIHLVDTNTGEIIDLEDHGIVLPELPKNFTIGTLDLKIYGTFENRE